MSSTISFPTRLVLTILASSTVLALPRRDIPSQPRPAGNNALQMGVFHTALEMEGHVTSFPFATATVTQPMPHLHMPLAKPTPHLASDMELQSSVTAEDDNVDPFQAVGTSPAPSQIKARNDHPIPRLNIGQQDNPLQTNKFYANFYLGDQGSPIYTHPYSLTWSKGGGPASSHGMAVTQLEYGQRSFGPPSQAIPGNPAANMVNPVGVQNLIISATELSNSTVLSTNKLESFSAEAVLSPAANTDNHITFPMTQGMGLITAIYKNLSPLIQAGASFGNLTTGASPGSGIFKYSTKTSDGQFWLIYAIPSNQQDPKFTLSSPSTISGPKEFSGVIQIAKNPKGTQGEAVYDASAGVYATSANLTGSVNGNTGSYTITWTKAGLTGRKLLMWALPHHISSFCKDTAAGVQQMNLATTTKGNGTAVVADSWTMVESELPASLAFAPWDPATGNSNVALSGTAISAISAAAISEMAQDMSAQSNLNSMYYSGKALAKFASVIYVAKDILKNDTLTTEGLTKLETAFSLFSTNQQQFPLVYDDAWGGVVSSASYVNGDLGSDFGNTAYNDHHFHWGYFIYAAAVIGSLDPSWLEKNKDWVNNLVRDASNPSATDNVYPVFRNFDWYHGHSWAHGLFAAADGKNEESSSEDTNFAYAIKLWGKVIGDKSMEARGNLMLSVLSRSLNSYFLYQDDNTIMPPQWIGNKVSGILFENKIDHTTYFGANLEYVQGIHMLPILPHSALIRKPKFVQEEWEDFFAENAIVPASKVAGGWRGVLYSNLALYDPKNSYAFFSQPNFNASWLDGGASLTWSLTYAAGRGGA